MSAAARDESFPRAARLLTRRDFDFVFGQASRSADRYFTVLARPRPDGGIARLGLVVPRKVSRRAVDRNRIRRVTRESFRKHRALLQNLDLVVLPRPAAVAISTGQMHAALSRHWRRQAELYQKRNENPAS